MDVVYTTINNDIGVLKNFMMDFEANYDGATSNDFQISLAQDNNCLDIGQYVYVNGTEYGGRIDKLKVITSSDEIFYTGRNWRGLIASKIIQPEQGEPYYIVNGNLNSILQQLIEDLELDDIFSIKTSTYSTTINYQFKR